MMSEAIPQKITQLQCAQTNTYLQTQFMQWLAESFKYQPTLLAHLHHELELLLAIAEFKLTLALDKPQPGDFLQNIQYQTLTKTQKIMWIALTAVLPYLLKKLTVYANTKDTSFWRFVQMTIIRIQKLITVLQFVNYAVFIRKGQYRSITQRLLRMKMRFIDSKNKRILNFALMNRMMVWQVYELFMKTVLPHVFSFCSGPLKNLFYMSSYLHPDTSLDKKTCVFCASKTPVMPHKSASCQHLSCYYCCKSNKTDKCPLCSQPIQQWKPLII